MGGAERCLVNLATGLDPHRFAPVVYSLAPRPEGRQAELVAMLEAAQTPVRFANVDASWHLLAALRRFRRWLSEQSPHILQTFLFHANVVGALAARRRGEPAVVTGIRVADPSRWRQFVERALIGRVERIVCVSQSVADLAATVGKLPRDKLVVIPNGLDIQRYPAEKAADLTQFGVPAGSRTILYAGRLHPQKGLDWMLRLTPPLLDQLPDCRLLIVGDGPQQAELQRLCRNLGIAERIHFAGWRPDLAEILRGCALLVLPSRWEGMPNVLMEAMASGLPIVATRAPGVEELLGPLADRQAVPLGAAEAFVSKIVWMLQNPRKAADLGNQNRRRVSQHYTIRRMIASYEQLYESLANRPPRR